MLQGLHVPTDTYSKILLLTEQLISFKVKWVPYQSQKGLNRVYIKY